MSYTVPLVAEQTYHIFNRGNDGCDLFRFDWTYERFIQLLRLHVCPIAEIFAFCLLRNHFHLMARIRDQLTLDQVGLSPSRCLSNMFNAFTRTVNSKYGRTGVLFETPFERKPVTTDDYFRALLIYIHRNAQKHGFVPDFRLWGYNSYSAYTSEQPTFISTDFPIMMFGGRQALIGAHFASPELELSPFAPYLECDEYGLAIQLTETY